MKKKKLQLQNWTQQHASMNIKFYIVKQTSINIHLLAALFFQFYLLNTIVSMIQN